MNYLSEAKEAIDTLNKLVKLQKQKVSPSREEMINALIEAKNHAPLDITAIEFLQGDRYFMSWDSFSDADLYRKLSQYQQGLNAYLIRKTGQNILDSIK